MQIKSWQIASFGIIFQFIVLPLLFNFLNLYKYSHGQRLDDLFAYLFFSIPIFLIIPLSILSFPFLLYFPKTRSFGVKLSGIISISIIVFASVGMLLNILCASFFILAFFITLASDRAVKEKNIN